MRTEMADHTSFTPGDGHKTADPGNAKMAVTRRSALDIAVRTALSRADQYRILALPYPVEHQAFWQLLADLGVTQERLMDRMGAGP
jgi:hypothetical protein